MSEDNSIRKLDVVILSLLLLTIFSFTLYESMNPFPPRGYELQEVCVEYKTTPHQELSVEKYLECGFDCSNEGWAEYLIEKSSPVFTFDSLDSLSQHGICMEVIEPHIIIEDVEAGVYRLYMHPDLRLGDVFLWNETKCVEWEGRLIRKGK